MKRASQVMMLVGLMLVSVTAQAQAQMLKWSDRVFVNVNGAYQNHAAADVTSSSEFTLYDEKASTSTAQTIESKGGMLDVSGGVRVFGNFGVGAGYTTITKKATGVVSARAPHPILYDTFRSVSVDITDLTHKEQAFHTFALFMLPLTAKFDVALFGGPTFFSLEQDTLNNPQIQEVGPPYSAINLSSVTKVTTTTNKVGFNVGLDATFKIMKNVGLGGFFRYSAAKVEFTPEGGSALSVEVGGMQAGGGLRIRF